jgi:hypothetical protein
VIGSPHAEVEGIDVLADPVKEIAVHMRTEIKRLFDLSKVFVPKPPRESATGVCVLGGERISLTTRAGRNSAHNSPHSCANHRVLPLTRVRVGRTIDYIRQSPRQPLGGSPDASVCFSGSCRSRSCRGDIAWLVLRRRASAAPERRLRRGLRVVGGVVVQGFGALCRRRVRDGGAQESREPRAWAQRGGRRPSNRRRRDLAKR